MLVSVKWLKEIVDTDLSTREIAHRMTMAGLEAEKITRIGADWESIFVGEVMDIQPHPDADRLVLATVHAGEHQLTVVTGAPNIQQGQKVALALLGANLIDPYAEELTYRRLKGRTMRGVRSEGMVCSEKELGLSDEHEGILVLDANAPVGIPLSEYLGDDIIEFEITPNLVHAFSIFGIARELAAVLDRPSASLKLADLDAFPRDDHRVTICEPELCGRFTRTVVENVTIKPSPGWLQRRLLDAGLRPINNWVDLSNYVMLEVGHPTHPFDADKLASDEIIVRVANPGETMETIDHVWRELDEETLVIADKEKAVGIAGIIGGAHTEVDEQTTRILLESAWFEPNTVRPTTRRLKINTDASARFGRNIDPNGASIAAARIIELAKSIDPDARVTEYSDVFVNQRFPRELQFKFSEIERLLGMEIPFESAMEILTRLDFTPRAVTADGEQCIAVTVPTYRNDVNLPADMVEEIARIYGYDALPETLITGQTPPVVRDSSRLTTRVVQDALVEAGLFEVQTYTMINDDDLRLLSPANDEIPYVLGGYPRPEVDYVRATNPLRSDWTIMRPTMIPSLLKIASENLKFSERVAIFETAFTYQPVGIDQLPEEQRTVSVLLSGLKDALSPWMSQREEFDFFDIKGVLELLFLRLGAQDVSFERIKHPSMHPGRTAAIVRDGLHIGIVGELHPTVAARFLVNSRTAVAELILQSFTETLLETWNVSPIGRFQPIRQDFAFIVDDPVPAGSVEQAIKDGAGQTATSIELFDVYSGQGIEAGKKSLAFRVTFSAPTRQIDERELEYLRSQIEQHVFQELGGVIRS